MRFDQRNDFSWRVGVRCRIASDNVELEQCAHTVDFFASDGGSQCCSAVVNERVLVDAGSAQQL